MSESDFNEYGVKLPDVGEGVAEAEVVEWLVVVGEEVTKDQAIAEVMTDKATVEIAAPVSGSVLSLNGVPGDLIAVGDDLVVLSVEGPVDPVHTPSAKQPAPSAAAPENEPAAPEPTTTRAPVGQSAPEVPLASKAAHLSSNATRPLASPAVRKRALESGIELRFVQGSGPAGRISHADLDAYLHRGEGTERRNGQSTASAAGLPTGRAHLPNEIIDQVPLVGLRRRIAEQMTVAKSRIPHITYVEEIDVTALEELRAHLNSELTASGDAEAQPKLTVLPFIICATRSALVVHPEMNARFDDDAGVVHRFGAFHCGVAADTPKGLVVPVVRHAETLDLWMLAREIGRLANGARTNALKSEELSGSTFTISSLGALGGVASTPVINHPEVAILAVNKIIERPVVVDGNIVVRKMMNLSGSFDHRVVDGMDVARFMQRIKAGLEHPAALFIDRPQS